jgi:hypothetical protein
MWRQNNIQPVELPRRTRIEDLGGKQMFPFQNK